VVLSGNTKSYTTKINNLGVEEQELSNKVDEIDIPRELDE
jgi:hypothetical protein